MHPQDHAALEVLRTQLADGAFLFDDPDAYLAGVDDALTLVPACPSRPSRPVVS